MSFRYEGPRSRWSASNVIILVSLNIIPFFEGQPSSFSKNSRKG